jgi:hypothetical protein
LRSSYQFDRLVAHLVIKDAKERYFMYNNTKAVRAQIKLGDIDIDVFQLPDGSYRLSKTQTCEAIDLDPKRLSELLEKNSLKSIAGKGSSLSEKVVKMGYEGNNAKVDLLPIEMSVLIWTEVGTDRAKTLLFACTVESIERRADIAFNVIRTEEERNQRIYRSARSFR